MIRKARRGSLVSFLLTGSGLAAGLLMQAMFARRLGAPAYGVFAGVQGTLLVLATICPLGWLEGVPKFIALYREERSDGLLSGVIYRALLVCALATALVSLALTAIASVATLNLATRLILLGIALLLPSYTLIRLQQQILLTMQRVADGLLFVHLLVPVVCIAGLQLLPRVGAIEVLFLYWTGCTLAFGLQGLRLWSLLPRTPREFRIREWHAVTNSLVTGLLGQRLMNQGDVMILSPFVGVAALGTYSLARRLVDVIAFGNQALASALSPVIGASMVGGRPREAARLLRFGCFWSALWALPWLLAAVLMPDFILSHFGPGFAEGAEVLRIAALGAFFNAATGPVGQALLVGGHEAYWRLTATWSAYLGLIGYLLGAWLGGAVGMALVRTLFLVGLNGVRWLYLERVLRVGSRE